MERRCVVSGCRNYWQPVQWVTYYRIPEDPTNRQEWIDALDLTEDGYVCCEHFNISDFTFLMAANNRVIKKLKENALPSKSGKKKTDYTELDIKAIPIEHIKEELKEEIVVKEEYEILENSQASETSITVPAEFKKVLKQNAEPEEEYFTIEVPNTDELLLEQLLKQENNNENESKDQSIVTQLDTAEPDTPAWKDDEGTDSDVWDTDNEPENAVVTAEIPQVLVQNTDYACPICAIPLTSQAEVLAHAKQKHGLNQQQLPVLPRDGPLCTTCNIRFVSQHILFQHKKNSPKHPEYYYSKKPAASPAKSAPKAMPPLQRKPEEPDLVRGRPRQRRRRGTAAQTRDKNNTVVFDEPQPCQKCGELMNSPREYHSHFRVNHPRTIRTLFPNLKTPFLCDVCGQVYNCNASLQDHMRSHSDVALFPCAICGKKFKRKMSWYMHQNVHNGITVPCPLCGKRFSCKGNMERHVASVHKEVEDVQCDYCPRMFKTRERKNYHVVFVHLKRPWPKRNRDRASERRRRAEAEERARIEPQVVVEEQVLTEYSSDESSNPPAVREQAGGEWTVRVSD